MNYPTVRDLSIFLFYFIFLHRNDNKNKSLISFIKTSSTKIDIYRKMRCKNWWQGFNIHLMQMVCDWQQWAIIHVCLRRKCREKYGGNAGLSQGTLKAFHHPQLSLFFLHLITPAALWPWQWKLLMSSYFQHSGVLCKLLPLVRIGEALLLENFHLMRLYP